MPREPVEENRLCEVCGAPVNRNPKPRDAARCCSRQCGFKLQALERRRKREARAHFTPVEFCRCRCGKVFRATKAKKFCSPACTYDAQMQRSLVPRERVEKTCAECGEAFSFIRGQGDGLKALNTIYCSKRCANKLGRRKRKALERYGIERSDAIRFAAVWDRDGGRCHICRGLCFKGFDVNHPLHVELEHIVPLSKGGTNTQDNVGVAHRICNGMKRDLLGWKHMRYELRYVIDGMVDEWRGGG